MKKFFYCLVAAMLLAACTKDETSIAKIEEVKNPYAVTPDEAVQLLKTVIGGESTRAVTIGDIKTLRKSDFVPTTRGGEDGDLIYIVDLENGGSAVMGADKRMEPIYAILDETKISPEKLTQTATRGDDGEEDIEDYVMVLMNKKIEADAMALIPTYPEMPIIPRPIEVTFTTMLGSKYPMLRTKWHQESPYNDLYPRGDGEYFVNGVMIAGCGPIALAQLLYYYKTPNAFGLYTFNWDLLSECEYQGAFSEAACVNVAQFVTTAAGWVCKNRYLSDGANPSVSPQDMVTAMYGRGFNNCELRTYEFIGLKSLLDDDMPVLTRGSDILDPTSDWSVGHVWVVDGYKSYRESTYLREFYGKGPRDYTDTFISSTDYNLVHCNYGWGGFCDGYYLSGIFDTTSQLDNDMLEDELGDTASSNLYNFDYNTQYIYYEM